MAVELVTGHAGSSHVTSAQAGAFNAGLAGTGSYVLGDAPSVTTATNSVTIGPCDLLIEGRHVRLTGATSVDIASGTTGYQRYDRICVRYSMATDGSGVETAELVVIEGTPSASSAEVPSITNDGSVLDSASPVDVEVARVTVDGLAPSTEWLLDALPVLSGMGGLPAHYYESTPTEAAVTAEHDAPCLVVVSGGTVYLVE